MEKKCTALQFSLIFLLTVSSVSVYVMPLCFTRELGGAGILVPVIGILLIGIFMYFFRALAVNSEKIYAVLNRRAKPVIKIGEALLILWLMFTVIIKARLFYERISSTSFSFLPKSLCIGALLVLAAFTVSCGFKTFSRLAQSLFIVFVILIVTIILISLKSIEFDNFNFIFNGSLNSILKAFVFLLEPLAYISFFLVMFKETDVKGLNKKFLLIIFGSAAVMIVITALCIGVFGSDFCLKLAYPFFSILKNTTISGSIEHFESVLISLWMIVDFVFITMLVFCIHRMSADLFGFEKHKLPYRVTPCVIAAVIFVLSLFPFASRFKLDSINQSIIPIVNVIAGVALPFIISVAVFFIYGRKKKDLSESKGKKQQESI